MGQKCCTEGKLPEYNDARTKRNSTKQMSEKNSKEKPSLLPIVESVQRRLGEFKYKKEYERGEPGKLLPLDNEGTFYEG